MVYAFCEEAELTARWINKDVLCSRAGHVESAAPTPVTSFFCKNRHLFASEQGGDGGGGGGHAAARSRLFLELLWGSGRGDRRLLAAPAALARPCLLPCLSFSRLWDEPWLVGMSAPPAHARAVLCSTMLHVHMKFPPCSSSLHHPRARLAGQDGTRILLGPCPTVGTHISSSRLPVPARLGNVPFTLLSRWGN